jgi:hypothetical protein
VTEREGIPPVFGSDRDDVIEALEAELSEKVSARDLTIRDLRAELAAERKLLDALVASLPKCDDCDLPATKAFARGERRFCDAHGGMTPDYPRAPALRAIAAAKEAKGTR